MKRPWDGNAPQIPKAFHARWTQQGSLAPPTMFISPSTLGFRLGPPVREPETRVWDKQNIAEMLPESTGEGVQKGDRQGKDEKESGPERVACWASHDLGRASELSHVRGRTKASHTMLVLPCLRAAPQTSTPILICLGLRTFWALGLSARCNWVSLLSGSPGEPCCTPDLLLWPEKTSDGTQQVRSHWHASHGGAERQQRHGHPVASAPPALSPHKPLTAPPPSCCLPLSTSHSTPASRDSALTFPTPMTSGPLHWLLPLPGIFFPRHNHSKM